MKTKIICVFPGVDRDCLLDKSKTFFFTRINLNKSEPYEGYIKTIKNNIGKVDIIFIDTDKNIMKMLDDEKIDYSICRPNSWDTEIKKDYMKKYKENNESKEFLSFMDKNFEHLLTDLFYLSNHHEEYVLNREETLMDAIIKERTITVSIGCELNDLYDKALKMEGNYMLEFNGVHIRYYPGMTRPEYFDKYNDACYKTIHLEDEEYSPEFLKAITKLTGMNPVKINNLNIESYKIKTFSVEFENKEVKKIALIKKEHFIDNYIALAEEENIKVLKDNLFDLFENSTIKLKPNYKYLSHHFSYIFENGYQEVLLHSYSKYIICNFKDIEQYYKGV